MQIPEAVGTLERDLRGIFADRLQSIVAYGLQVGEPAGAHDHTQGSVHARERPHAHTLAIVETLTPDDLRECAGRVARWHAAGLATPLLLAAHEFERSLDAFPLEFGAIVADHVVVSGRSPFDGVSVNAADLRRACEVQARSHLLHLREGYLETRDKPEALAVLIVRSAAPFAALLKSIARLQGLDTHDAGAVGRQAERTLDVPGGNVCDVIKLANVTEIPAADAVRLFPAYLDAVGRLVKFVDTWSR